MTRSSTRREAFTRASKATQADVERLMATVVYLRAEGARDKADELADIAGRLQAWRRA